MWGKRENKECLFVSPLVYKLELEFERQRDTHLLVLPVVVTTGPLLPLRINHFISKLISEVKSN